MYIEYNFVLIEHQYLVTNSLPLKQIDTFTRITPISIIIRMRKPQSFTQKAIH